MPCYQMNLMNVEFKAKNKRFLLDALTELNITFDLVGESVVFDGIVIDLLDQTVEFSRYQSKLVNLVKREYARQVIHEVSKKKRWVVAAKNKRQLQLKKY